jgi:hypothetical protein
MNILKTQFCLFNILNVTLNILKVTCKINSYIIINNCLLYTL